MAAAGRPGGPISRKQCSCGKPAWSWLQGTSITTSRLGLGTHSLHRLFAPAARRDLLARALDLGVLHFDTAPSYGDGLAEREIGRILRRLSGEVGKVARRLNQALEAMAQLDYVSARARFSREYQMFAPEVTTERRLWLREARHPLLEHLFRGLAQDGQALGDACLRVFVPLELEGDPAAVVVAGEDRGDATVIDIQSVPAAAASYNDKQVYGRGRED